MWSLRFEPGTVYSQQTSLTMSLCCILSATSETASYFNLLCHHTDITGVIHSKVVMGNRKQKKRIKKEKSKWGNKLMRSLCGCACVLDTRQVHVCLGDGWHALRAMIMKGQLRDTVIHLHLPLFFIDPFDSFDALPVSILTSKHTEKCWKAYSLPVSELFIEPCKRH